MAERKGLSRPTDPARELQEIMRAEAQEGRKEASQEDTGAHRQETVQTDSREAVRQAVQEDRKETAGLSALLPVQTDWREAVKALAKAPPIEGKRARLNVDVPADVHLRVKVWCLQQGYQLNELVPALLQAFIEGEE